MKEPAILPANKGGHNYPDPDGTSDCLFGCGAWLGPSSSGGPSPFGKCPKNKQKPQAVDATFEGWLSREDYGYREQLERCWQKAQALALEAAAPRARQKEVAASISQRL